LDLIELTSLSGHLDMQNKDLQTYRFQGCSRNRGAETPYSLFAKPLSNGHPHSWVFAGIVAIASDRLVRDYDFLQQKADNVCIEDPGCKNPSQVPVQVPLLSPVRNLGSPFAIDFECSPREGRLIQSLRLLAFPWSMMARRGCDKNLPTMSLDPQNQIACACEMIPRPSMMLKVGKMACPRLKRLSTLGLWL
jgi:hypothetical protein